MLVTRLHAGTGAPETHSHMDFMMLRVNTASDIWRLMAQTAIQVGHPLQVPADRCAPSAPW